MDSSGCVDGRVHQDASATNKRQPVVVCQRSADATESEQQDAESAAGSALMVVDGQDDGANEQLQRHGDATAVAAKATKAGC